MRNLLRLQDLTTKEIESIINKAQTLKHKKTYPTALKNKIVANLFFEPSTRTQYSFNVAEYKLGCKPINFSVASSSIAKGESFYDTVKTFDSFGIDLIVLRHAQDAWHEELTDKIDTPLINAGDGKLDHPSQTLLDLMTIKEHFGSFHGLKVLIVGDIAHSRVAHSNRDAMQRLGMKVYFAAPEEFRIPELEYVDLDEYISKVDVVNMLRIQNERLASEMSMTIQQYNKLYGLNQHRVDKMKPKAIIIHPAPFNRNVEINDDIVECNKSKIFPQIQNGVFIRMAMLLWVLGHK